MNNRNNTQNPIWGINWTETLHKTGPPNTPNGHPTHACNGTQPEQEWQSLWNKADVKALLTNPPMGPNDPYFGICKKCFPKDTSFNQYR